MPSGYALTRSPQVGLETRGTISTLAGQLKLTDALLEQRILHMVIRQGPSLPAVALVETSSTRHSVLSGYWARHSRVGTYLSVWSL